LGLFEHDLWSQCDRRRLSRQADPFHALRWI